MGPSPRDGSIAFHNKQSTGLHLYHQVSYNYNTNLPSHELFPRFLVQDDMGRSNHCRSKHLNPHKTGEIPICIDFGLGGTRSISSISHREDFPEQIFLHSSSSIAARPTTSLTNIRITSGPFNRQSSASWCAHVRMGAVPEPPNPPGP